MTARYFRVVLTVTMQDYSDHGSDPTISAIDGILHALDDAADLVITDYDEEELVLVPAEPIDYTYDNTPTEYGNDIAITPIAASGSDDLPDDADKSATD